METKYANCLHYKRLQKQASKIKKLKSAQKTKLTLQKLKSHFTGELSRKLQSYKVLVIHFINKI